jgi:hypothetical protein
MHPSQVTHARPRLRAARLRAALALLLAACSEPRFPTDAGADDADADASEPASADSRAGTNGSGWAGRYAARSFLYSLDGLLRPSAEDISLVVIEAEGDGYTLQRQPCLYEGHVSFLLEGNLRYEYPRTLPPVRSALIADGAKFSTELAHYTVGFTRELPDECDSASSAPSVESWVSGSCQCPEDRDALPARPDDCRVDDPEQDGLPGARYDVVVSSGMTWSYQTAQEVEFRYVNGFRRGDRLYADVDTDAHTVVLSCSEPGNIAAGCSLQDSTPCPARYNDTVFVLVEEEYDCARVIAEKNTLFPTPLPDFPAGCLSGS